MEQIRNFFNSAFGITVTKGVTTVCVKLVVAALIIILGLWLVSLVMKLISKSKLFSKVDPTAKDFVTDALKIILRVVVLLTAAAYLGVPMTSVVTVLGSAGVAIGLALQGGLSNIAGGVMILTTHPFRVGDYIEVSGTGGTVHGISIYYTVLYTPDNKRVVIPNGSITSATVINYSACKTRRVDLKFNVAYSSDIDKVKEVIGKTVEADERILDDPKPVIVLSAHDESSLTFTVRVWVETAEYWNVNFALLENVKKAFDKEGIEIPFPQLDVHIDK